MRTLIVDDDADQRLVVRTMLEQAGIGPIAEAVDGPAAIVAAARESPALILLDIAMPGPSGLEVLPQLIEAAPAARVVILSNYPSRLLGAVAQQRGAVGYVEKRVPADLLVHEILVAAAIAETALAVLSAELPAASTSPSAARNLLRDAVGDQDDDLLFRLELLVTEVVTNAVVHASSAPRLEAQVGSTVVRVSVHDDDPRPPARREPDADRPGGRGLLLLDQLASRWGVEPHDRGKAVWFELDRPGPEATAPV